MKKIACGCILVGKMNNDLAKIAKICFEYGLTVKSIQNDDILLDILAEYSDQVYVIFLANSYTEDTINYFDKYLDKYKVVICGDQSLLKFEQISFPVKKSDIIKIISVLQETKFPIIYADAKMQELFQMSKHVALSNASILITGESGTGKEVVTQFIHKNSNRADNTFVAVNCAAIPENLLESELFGHEKGAFTGALNQRIGKFEEAHNGTLFLDEISEMSLNLQAKLLRAVQEKEITRLGGNNVIKVNCRIIASSNRNLEQFITGGKFREDLYYRLNVINIKIPPLRDRKEDIIVLSEYFIEKYSKQNGKSKITLSENAIKSLLRYDWPGNVRELENVIHRAIVLGESSVITNILSHDGYPEKQLDIV